MKRNWPKHDYSVRNVKTFRGMEGEGFNATLYRDGHRIAFVIDDATGGDMHIQWADARSRGAEEKRLLEFLKTLPKERWEDTEYDVTPDIFLDALVGQAQAEKRLKRLFEKETLFRLKSRSALTCARTGPSRTFSPIRTPARCSDVTGALWRRLRRCTAAGPLTALARFPTECERETWPGRYAT